MSPCTRRWLLSNYLASRWRFGSRPRGCSPSAVSSYAAPSTKSRNCLPRERACGVITYSSGNHAQGVAYAARALGAKAVIVMPSQCAAGESKGHPGVGSGDRHRRPSQRGAQSQGRRAGRRIRLRRHSPLRRSRHYCRAGKLRVGDCCRPAGRSTWCLAPVGGGGLLSGVAAAVKLSRPGVRVIGVEPELASDAAESFKAGRIVSFTGEQTADRGRWVENARA